MRRAMSSYEPWYWPSAQAAQDAKVLAPQIGSVRPPVEAVDAEDAPVARQAGSRGGDPGRGAQPACRRTRWRQAPEIRGHRRFDDVRGASIRDARRRRHQALRSRARFSALSSDGVGRMAAGPTLSV